MKFEFWAVKALGSLLKPFGYAVVPKEDLIDYCVHQYSSYEEYRAIQVAHNKRKLDRVWADERTLQRVADLVGEAFPGQETIRGICHGARNGYEQNFLNQLSDKLSVIGTDISETAQDFENSVQWDFHDTNDDWLGTQDFVYSNSLDQSWQPHVAIQTWLAQLKPQGLLIIEHTEAHGPRDASKMDPFGVRPTVMPYVLTLWFGAQISITHSVEKKANNRFDAWLFVVRKNVDKVEYLPEAAVEKLG